MNSKMAAAIVQDYTTSLEDLTFNSKPHINALTMLAEEYLPHAVLIVRVIEAKLHKGKQSGKLPIMYLMDSIVKNVGGNYTPLFAKNIVKTFYSTFERGDEKIKMSLYKLRSTWDSYFPLKRLYELDAEIHAIDQNWPVKPLPASLQETSSTSIHINPKFIKKSEHPATSVSSLSASVSRSKAAASDSIDLKQDLINKQRQLLELQQRKLLLELEQTRQQLALREKRNQASHPLKDPRIKGAATAQSSLRVTLSSARKQPPKDPRNTTAAPTVKPNVSTQVKGVSDSRIKSEGQKKAVSEKARPASKKSPSDLEKQAKKKNDSPNSSGKTTVEAQRTLSSKTSPKSDSYSKKTKVLKNKTEGNAIKRLSDEKSRCEASKSVQSDNLDQQKPLLKTDPKKRDRPERRPPARDSLPPAKQPRRSTFTKRSKSPPRRVSEPHRRPFPKPLREEELRRDSPRSNEGSISPRFSPESDEAPHPGTRQNWRPPVKRMRQQGPPGPWRPDDHIQDCGVPLERRRSNVDPSLTIPQELTLSHQAEILKQAEIQLQSGHLTHTQHQELLKQLHQLFELQRLRNFLHRGGCNLAGPSESRDRPRMPLDDLLPQHHGPDATRRESIQRNDENRPPHFRPPLSPPQMEVGRDGGYRRPPVAMHLTPPPMPPSLDQRSNRNLPPPHPEDSRLWHGRDDFPRHPHGPGFDIDRGVPPRRGMGRGIQGTERRPSPELWRGNNNWDHPPPPRSSNFGEDLGNVFVMDEEERFQHPPHHEPGPNNELPDLHNGSKPLPDRIPLRAYAHPEAENAGQPKGMKRRGSLEGRGRPHSPPRKKVLERKKSLTLKKESPSKEQRDNEDEGPHLEEPEDYIIANIPPGAEAYHEHSMKLNAHKKNSMVSQYTMKLAESSKEDADASEKGKASENLSEEPIYSQDISRRDRLEEEVNKSPSLPLKKRKYLISSSNEIKDSGDGVPSTEPESELLAPPLIEPTAPVDEKEEQLKKEEDKNLDKVVTEELQAPVPQEEVVEKKGESKIIEKKEMQKDEEIQKAKSNSKYPAVEETVAVKQEPLRSMKENQRVRTKKHNERKNDKNGRLQRIQQLAEVVENKVQDQGPRGKQFPRSRGDIARIKEEERLRGLMMEEEDRLRWEADLEMRLKREEFLEMQQQRETRRNRSPPRRGWGRGDDGPRRGRGGPGRGSGWDRDGHFWDDGPPFRGRPRPRRMPQRHRRDEEKRVRLWDEPLPPGPIRGPMPPGRLAERNPPLVPDPGMGGSGGPARPLPLRGPDRPQSNMNQVNVNKLLSDLLNMGIIPGSAKKEVKTIVITQQKSNETQKTTGTVQSDVAMEPSNSQEELSSLLKAGLSSENNRVPTPVFEDFLTLDPDAKLPDVTLDDVDKLKWRHEELIKRLYSGIQCSACGMRFTACQTDMYAEHLDWHYRLNCKDRDGVRETHRMLYPTAGEWIVYEEIVDPSQRAKSQVFDEADFNEMEAINDPKDSQDLVVPVALNPEKEKCDVCHEAFKTIYNDEAEEWQYVNCVAVDNINFHPTCYADHNDSKDVTSLPTPERLYLYNPLELMKGIPGLDSLREDVEIEKNPLSGKTQDTATNAEIATPWIEGEVKEESKNASAEEQEKEAGAETSKTVAAVSQPAVSQEVLEEEETDQPLIITAAVMNEQAIVKEERPTTPTDSSYEHVAHGVNGMAKPPENERVESLDPVEDAVESQDPVEDAVEPRHLVQDAVESRDPVQDAIECSRDPVEDAVESRDLVEDVIKSRDPAKDAIESRDPVKDAIESRDPVKDAVESPDPVEAAVESRDPMVDAIESRDPVEAAVEFLDPMEDAVESLEPVPDATQPSTSGSSEPVTEQEPEENAFQTLVKLEMDKNKGCHFVPECVAQSKNQERPPFLVAPCDTGHEPVTPVEKRTAKVEPVSQPSGIKTLTEENLTKAEPALVPEENSIKAKPVFDLDNGFPIPIVPTIARTESDLTLIPKFEPTVGVTCANLEGSSKLTVDENFLNEMHDESDLDYDDSDISVTI